MSLVEVVLVGSILMMLASTLVETSTSMSRVTSSGSAQAQLLEQGNRALKAILADLRRSGMVTLDGLEYPYVFDDGNASDGHDQHDHVVCNQEADANDNDFGIMRELILALPADLDENGIPDLDMNGNGWPEFDGDKDGTASESDEDYAGIDWDPAEHTIEDGTGVVWTHSEVSYVTVTHPDGINYLERRTDAGLDGTRRVARDVELVQFDTWESSGYTIPINSVRVRIFLRRRTLEGALFSHRVEAVVKMRNTKGVS